MKVEQEKIIKEFLTQMAEQDNRCTAFPYFYVIKTKESHAVGRDRNDIDETFACAEDYDDIELYNDDWETVDPEEYKELPEKERTKVYVVYHYVEKGMFLTDKDAKDHLRLNHYHYSKDAYTYVKHAWRAPDLHDFLRALFQYFNIEKKNLDIKGGK